MYSPCWSPSHLPLYLIPLGLPSAPGLSNCLMHPTWAGDLFHPRLYICFDAVLIKRLFSSSLSAIRVVSSACSNYNTIALISHANKVMLKILQARLQQYMNWEIPDVQDGFRKGRGTRDQIANIHWIIEKARKFQKIFYFIFSDYTEAFDCVDHNKLWKILQEMEIPGHLSCLLRNLCRSRSNS